MSVDPIHLRSGGVSLVLTPSSRGAPVVAHWGADLGALAPADLAALAELHGPGVPQSALDVPRVLSLLPTEAAGFTGTPAVEGWRLSGQATAQTPSWIGWTALTDADAVTLRARDDDAGLGVEVELGLSPRGLLRVRTTLTNVAAGEYAVAAVRNVLPVAAHATELLDLTGRWVRERAPQRHAWQQGKLSRESRHGRPGHDATLLLVAGTPGFSFRRGEVWGIHVAWSGDHTTYAERTPAGDCLLGGGELLRPGEVVLGEGESYTTPWLFGAYAGHGLDEMSTRLHHWVRTHAPHPNAIRPVVLNTWEATYFDHDRDRLIALADAAGELGVERFVLDDGWFHGRRHDRAGLGDWAVDLESHSDGLHPLIEHVRSRGMEFGLWVEPEMVSVDSDLARAHPDWLLRGRSELPTDWRHQQVLDLQNPAAFAHVRDALLALLDEYPISFVKWDHNRDVIDALHSGRPAVHGQTRALYRLLDALRNAHPAVEFESCASGGARIDLEILTRTDRIWPSDTTDPLERQHIQRWTSLLVPPEMIGAHVGAPTAHTTGRRHRLGFRAATALLGHFGIEWDVTELTPAETAELGSWIELRKRVRTVVTGGELLRPDHPDPAVLVTGVVAADASAAYFVIAVIASTATEAPTMVALAGLEPDRRYRVRCVTPAESARHVIDRGQTWLDGPGVDVLGGVLMTSGVQLPATPPETAYVLEVRSLDSTVG